MNVKETEKDCYVRTNWDKVLDQARVFQRGFLMRGIPAAIIKNQKILEAKVIVELDKLSIPGVEEIIRTDQITLRYDLKKDCIIYQESYKI